MAIQSKLATIQQNLHAPKNQRNNFGKYNYRSCEDILEALKPILGDLSLTISDEIVMIGDRYYIKATATISDSEESISSTAYAREADQKKGMDVAQLSGASSSYARKYALNGLFCIDDAKDADTMDNRTASAPQQQPMHRTVTPMMPATKTAIVAEVERLQLPSDNIAKAIKWASGGTAEKLSQLTEDQAGKLLSFLKTK